MVYPTTSAAIVKPYFGMVRELEICVASELLYTITVVRVGRSTSLRADLDQNCFRLWHGLMVMQQ
jgi:hypothetical protein